MARKSTKTTTTPRKTAPRKTTSSAAKPASKTATSASKADVAKAPLPKVVKVAEPVVASPELRKKELIDLVVARSGVKKKDAKPTVEALLAVLGECIADGRELNLQPFGKLKINRTEEKANGRVVVCRLRQSTANASGTKEPVAEPAE